MLSNLDVDTKMLEHDERKEEQELKVSADKKFTCGGDCDSEAVMFCLECKKRFCEKHGQVS